MGKTNRKLRAVQPIDPVRLKGYVERIEAVEQEQAAQKEAKADIYTEVKAAGMRPKMVRKIVRERARKEEDDAEAAELERYRAALAMPGATYRSVAAATGVPRSTLHRLVPREKNGTDERPAHDPQTGEITEDAPPPENKAAAPMPVAQTQNEHREIHRGAMPSKDGAEVVRAEPFMSGSVAASGDAVRDASAMPLDVAAAPHSEGREHVGSATSAPPDCPHKPDGWRSGSTADDDLAIPPFLKRQPQAVG